MKKNSWFIVLYVVIISFCFQSCDSSRVFEKNTSFDENRWILNDTLAYEIAIDDLNQKNVIVNLRHQFYFKWRNVWMDLTIKTPNGTVIKTPINLPLSETDIEWAGKCSGDVCEINYPVEPFQNYVFEDTGLYLFKLSHAMRTDTLENIISAGVRLENSIIE